MLVKKQKRSGGSVRPEIRLKGGQHMSERAIESLKSSLAAESQAYQRYMILADRFEEQASLSPTPEIVEILREAAQRLRETASEEMRHARMWLGKLEPMDDPLRELEACRAVEQADVEGYVRAAQSARQAGNVQQGALFDLVATAEKRHAKMYERLSERLQQAWLASRLG